jgi:hypothetical protein
MNLAQAATMPTVAGETVKPEWFRVPKICDIPARFWRWQIFFAGPDARFCRKIGVFGVPALPGDAALINGQFTNPGSMPLGEPPLCGKRLVDGKLWGWPRSPRRVTRF